MSTKFSQVSHLKPVQPVQAAQPEQSDPSIHPMKDKFQKVGVRPEAAPGPQAVKVEAPNEPVIREFTFNSLKSSSTSYGEVKSKFGPLAATDVDRKVRSQKDSRFTINPLLRDPLSIEEEEKRVIEEKVRIQVEAITEEAREKARAEGYQEGMKSGYSDALKKVQVDAAKSLAKFEQLIEELDRAKGELFKANERFLLELVYRIAKMVTLKELKLDNEYLLRLARVLIEQVGARDFITIKINPQDSEIIDSMTAGLKKNYHELVNLNIETSNQVSPGGCQVETEWNAIEAQVETQLKRIHEALFEENKDEGSSSGTPESTS